MKSEKNQDANEYRNKSVINQRGATLEINNSTDREEIKISQYSGSNISLNNLANVELATNNKQTKINHDSFETVGNDKTVFIANNKIERVVEDKYDLRGFAGESQILKAKEWRESYSDLAKKNSTFQIQRGGGSSPNGKNTPQSGSRAGNATLQQTNTVCANTYDTYSSTPIRNSSVDEVVAYTPVSPRQGSVASPTGPDVGTDVPKGNISYPEGPAKNSATEGGNWSPTPDHLSLADDIKAKQDQLNVIEQQLGNGGNEVTFVKRHKIETIGAINNNYPSVRVDPSGRSQPAEVTVGDNLAFVGVSNVPHVEEVNNDMNFPVGDYTLNVGNKYNIFTGSGGVQIKTSGAFEVGGTTCKIACNKVNIQGSGGVTISSEGFVELQSANHISIRSNKQILIEPGLGVKNNLIVGGGQYIEGELYTHHITAPLEMQETQDTTLYGKFNTNSAKTLFIAETYVPSHGWCQTFALPTDDLIVNYPHSHHFANLPLRLMDSNVSVRKKAQIEGINVNGGMSPSLPFVNARKFPPQTMA